MKLEIVITNIAQMHAFGRRLGKLLPVGSVVALTGNLGSGKTTLTQALAKGLKVRSRIHSPTFILSARHKTSRLKSGFFYHIDLYRLPQVNRTLWQTWDEFFEEKNITAMEWAEKAKKFLPSQRTIWIELRLVPGQSHARKLIIKLPQVAPLLTKYWKLKIEN